MPTADYGSEINFLDEIARLCSAAQRLTHDKIALNILVDRTTQERDEALAQVAVLMQTCEELADRIIALDASARILIPQGLPKARALLDRLQRAEAVVRDLVELGDEWIDVSTTEFYKVLRAAQNLVAAWEEGNI